MTQEPTKLQRYSISPRGEFLPLSNGDATDMDGADYAEAVDAELTRLTEKYSQKCERCGGDGHHLLEDCPVCHGTGRVWMMGVEEVKKLQKELEDERHEWFNRACTRILEGGGK